MKKVEAQNTVKVVVRCRPLDKTEKKNGNKTILSCDYNRKEVSIHADSEKLASYYYDKVFNSTASQEFVYRSTVAEIVEDTLKGFNCTVFAYGQTGTGKTYTMEGYRTSSAKKDNSPFWYGADAGMIPRAAQQIFQHMEACENNFSVFVTCLELYNEEVIDLLIPEGEPSKPLHIRDETNGKGVVVSGLQEKQVHSPEDIFKLLEGTSKRRHTAGTNSNDRSSRSHCIFTITVHSKEAADNGEDLLRTGKLNLVDLAGSENTKRSGATGIVMKQAAMINKSLLTLRRVITSLSSGKKAHIPFRDSKLTRLLQESLGGQAKTCMIATIAPSDCCLEETRSTLQYALSAKNIKNTPVVYQQLTKKAKIKEYEEEINSLRNQLAASCAADGVYVDQKTWNEHLANVEKFKELSTNIDNKEIHISQLQQQSDSRGKDLLIRAEEATQAEADLVVTREELEKVQEECEQSGDKILDQQAIIYMQQQTHDLLKEQAQNLKSHSQVVLCDLEKLHNSIQRYQLQLDEFQGHTCKSQEILCKSIIQTMQNLSSFQQSHQIHASKLSASWKNVFQCHAPFMKQIQEEKKSLFDFAVQQLHLANQVLLQDTQVQSKYQTEQSQLHSEFSESFMNEQSSSFDFVLDKLSALKQMFREFYESFSERMNEWDAAQVRHLKSYQSSMQEQQKIHRDHHKTVQEFTRAHRATVAQQKDSLESVCSAVEEAVALSHQNILKDIQQLLAESAKEQSKIFRERLEDVSKAMDENLPCVDQFEADQGSLILSGLENLQRQKKHFEANSSAYHKKSSQIIADVSENHSQMELCVDDLATETKKLKQETLESLDTYKNRIAALSQERELAETEAKDQVGSCLKEISDSTHSMFANDIQEPISTWGSFMESNSFLDTVSTVYSRNGELLGEQEQILKEVDVLVKNLSGEMSLYESQGNTPKKEKQYSHLLLPDSPEKVKRKKRTGSTRILRKSSGRGLIASESNTTENITNLNDHHTKSLLEKRKHSTVSQCKSTRALHQSSVRTKTKPSVEPTQKRRRLGDSTTTKSQ